MSVFLGTHQNRLDAKKRVSIPAGFRTVLRARAVDAPGGAHGDDPLMVLIPSLKQPCIDVWPMAAFLALGAPLERLDTFSDGQDDLAMALYGDAQPVDADKEGRIVLEDELVEHAGLTNQVAFMGMGETFQIWEPTAAKKRRDEARNGARLKDLSLPVGTA